MNILELACATLLGLFGMSNTTKYQNNICRIENRSDAHIVITYKKNNVWEISKPGDFTLDLALFMSLQIIDPEDNIVIESIYYKDLALARKQATLHITKDPHTKKYIILKNVTDSKPLYIDKNCHYDIFLVFTKKYIYNFQLHNNHHLNFRKG